MSWLRLLPGIWVNQNWLDVCRSLASWVRIHKSDNYGVSFITCWRALRESLSLEVFMPMQLQKGILWSLETSELLGTQIQNAKNVILLKPHIQKKNKKNVLHKLIGKVLSHMLSVKTSVDTKVNSTDNGDLILQNKTLWSFP